MSQAEALLNQAARSGMYTASPETEPHIVIGADRVIVVPDELKRLGVQFDHNIETVVFDCPRYWDDTDMSLMAVYINYERKDAVRGQYLAENVAVDETDETMMHFEWTISKNVTLVEGKVKFNVCIKSVDDEGNEEEHWNSELCEDCYISEGLESGAAIEQMYPDVITQLRTVMENVINSGMAVDVSMQKVDGVLHVTVTGPNGVEGFQIYDGNTPFIGENGNWWIGDTDTGVPAAASTTGFMPAATYDPQGKATDIYQYVDDAVTDITDTYDSQGKATDIFTYVDDALKNFSDNFMTIYDKNDVSIESNNHLTLAIYEFRAIRIGRFLFGGGTLEVTRSDTSIMDIVNGYLSGLPAPMLASYGGGGELLVRSNGVAYGNVLSIDVDTYGSAIARPRIRIDLDWNANDGTETTVYATFTLMYMTYS